MAKDKLLKEVAEKIWPKTKKELEKAIDNARKIIDKGEDYLKVVSEKSIAKTRKLSLGLQKEKLYYALGKALLSVPKSRWSKDKKINSLVKQIKDTDKIIRKLK